MHCRMGADLMDLRAHGPKNFPKRWQIPGVDEIGGPSRPFWRIPRAAPVRDAATRTKSDRLESLPMLLSDLVRVHPGRPAALPTATGWDEELLDWAAGVRLPRLGHSESSFRTDPTICPVMLRHRYR